MAFKPKSTNNGGNGGNYESRNFPVPKSGARKARVSLIIDLGTQKREPFEDPNTKEVREQKPCQQVVVFADLVADTVDYGGEIGKQHYRLLLNKSFAGVVQGVNFAAVPPKDKDGKLIEGKPWGFHPANLLTKLAKAVGKPEVITSMDIEELLGEAFIADVEVNETEDKNGKTDKDGNVIVYRNVNFKGASKVPMIETGEEDEDGNPIEAPAPVAELKQEARCITFDGATVEDIKFIRPNIIKIIKLAEDYAGSQMQKAIEEFEAEQKAAKEAAEAAGGDDDEEEEKKPAPKKEKETVKKAATTKKKEEKKPAPAPAEDEDEDVPF